MVKYKYVFHYHFVKNYFKPSSYTPVQWPI